MTEYQLIAEEIINILKDAKGRVERWGRTSDGETYFNVCMPGNRTFVGIGHLIYTYKHCSDEVRNKIVTALEAYEI